FHIRVLRHPSYTLFPYTTLFRSLTPNEAEMVGAQELQFVALGFVCMIISWIKLRPIYAVWMTGTWLLFTAVNFLQSVPRYTLTIDRKSTRLNSSHQILSYAFFCL